MQGGSGDIRSELLNAIRTNDAEGVRKVLKALPVEEKAVAMCRPIFDNKPLLQYALVEGKAHPSPDAFKAILECCTPDILNTADPYSNQPAFLALEAPKEYLDAMLDTKGVNWGVSNARGDTPLAHALKGEDIEFHQQSFAKLAQLHPHVLYRVNKAGGNILHAACESGNPDKVTFAMDLRNAVSDTPLGGAASRSAADLLNHKNGLGETPLHIAYRKLSPADSAIFDQHVQSADLLAKDKEGKSVIYRAVEANNTHVYDLCNGNAGYTRELVMCALEHDNQSIIDRLTGHQAQSTPENQPDLLKECVCELLKDPERLIRCLNSENPRTDLWQDLYNKLDTNDDRAAFACCAAASAHYRLRWRLTDSISHPENPRALNENLSLALEDGHNLRNPAILGSVVSKFPASDCISTDKIAKIALENPTASTLLNMLQHANTVDAAGTILKAISQRNCSGVSAVSEMIRSSGGEQILEFLDGVSQRAALLRRLLVQDSALAEGMQSLREEVFRTTVFLAQSGDIDKMRAVFKAMPDAVYAEDPISGKSALEMASDADHVQATRFLLECHKKISRNAELSTNDEDLQHAIESITQVARVDPDTASSMIDGILQSGKAIPQSDAERILRNAAPENAHKLAAILERTYPGLTEQVSRQQAVPTRRPRGLAELYAPRQSDAGPTGAGDRSSMHRIDDDHEALQYYGLLGKYVTLIKTSSDNAHKFKTTLKDDFKTFESFKQSARADATGHSIFTLVAMHGVPTQMDLLVSRFTEVQRENLAFRANYESFSSLGSPLQCAIKSGNLSMAHHLLGKMDPSKICTQYGASKDNLLHTLVKTGNLDILFDLQRLTKCNDRELSALVTEAILQKDANGRTPIDVAFSMGEESCSTLCAFISGAVQNKDVERLLGSSTITNLALKHNNPSAIKWVFDLAKRFNTSQETKGARTRIDVLGNVDNLEALISQTVQNDNPEVHRVLLEKIQEKYPHQFPEISRQLLVYLAKNNLYNAALFNDLEKSAQSFLDAGTVDSLVKQAVEYDNPDLIKHVPPATTCLKLLNMLGNRQDPDSATPQYAALKDNMLALLLANLDEGSFNGLAREDLISHIVSHNMLKACEVCLQRSPDNRALLLDAAIRSGNIQIVEAVLNRDPDVLLRPYNAPSGGASAHAQATTSESLYAFAASVCPETDAERAMLRYLAYRTVNAVLAKDRAANTAMQSGASSQHVAPQPGFVPSSEFANTLKGMLLRHNLDLSAEDRHTLDRHASAADGNAFQQTGSENLLRIALESRDCKAAEKLLKDYISRYGREPSDSTREIINQNIGGRSILHLAALNGNHKILASLIELGGDPALTTDRGENVAHLCTQSGMKKDNGEYVFASLITNASRGSNPLNTVDANGKGILAHAASCNDKPSTVEMLELIHKNPELDSQLLKRKEGAKRNEFLHGTIASAGLRRRDDAIDTFLDNNPQVKASAKQDLSLESLARAKHLDDDTLANVLTRASMHSFSEIHPLEPASTIVGRPRNVFIEHQRTLFAAINSGTLRPHDLEHMSRVPAEAFSARDCRTGVSPIEHAIAVKNLDFIKYVLEHRIGELRPNICNAEGDNLPVQISKFVAENPDILQQDRRFAELYTNFLERCHCTTQSQSQTSVRKVLGSNARLGALCDKAAAAAGNESTLKDTLSRIEHGLQESYEPRVVSQLAAFVKDNPEFSRNSANTFRTLFSRAISDAVSARQGISDHHRRYIKELIRNSDTRKLLTNVDHEGNNALQSILNELSKSKVGIGIAKADVLQEIFTEILDSLSNEDPELLKEILLKHRNARGENCLETLAAVKPSYGIFRAIETKLGAEAIADFCDLNTILVRAANQAALQRHIYENYAVFPVGGCDAEQNVRIHQAAISGDHDAFIATMQTGGNINQLDKDGNTPLQSLLIHLVQNRGNITDGHLKTLETLVAHGAALHHKNNHGLSACDMAKELKGPLFGNENSCLQLIAQHRLRYNKLKQEAQEETEKGFVRHKERYQSAQCDISGATIAVKLGSGTLLASKLLYSDLCNRNNLSRATFDFNAGQDQGYVEKVGNKRNYVATTGTVKLTLSWKPARGPEQKVTVMVHADGKIEVAPDSIGKCGAKGEKLNFNNCRVYVGGFSLEDALRNGVWKTAPKRSAAEDLERSQQHSTTRGTEQSPSAGEQRATGHGSELDEGASPTMRDVGSEPSADGPEQSGTTYRRQRSASYPDIRSNSALPQLQNYIANVSGPHLAPRGGSSTDSISQDGSPSGDARLQAHSDAGPQRTESSQVDSAGEQHTTGHGSELDGGTSSTMWDTGSAPSADGPEQSGAAYRRQRSASYPDLTSETVSSQSSQQQNYTVGVSETSSLSRDGSFADSTSQESEAGHYSERDALLSPSAESTTFSPIAQTRAETASSAESSSLSNFESRDATLGTQHSTTAGAHDEASGAATAYDDTNNARRQHSSYSDSEQLAPSPASALQHHAAAITGQAPVALNGENAQQIAPEAREWASITGVCNNVDNYYAFNTTAASNVTSAAAALKALYDGYIQTANNGQADIKTLRETIPTKLEEHGIESRNLGTDPSVTIRNGVVQHSSAVDVPDDWTSPYGFGNNLDAEIRSELQFIADVCNKSSMDCTISMHLKHLPMLALAVQKIRNAPPTGVSSDSPSLDRQDGERVLKDITNTCMLCDEVTVTSRSSAATAVQYAQQPADELPDAGDYDDHSQSAGSTLSTVGSYTSDDEGIVIAEEDLDYIQPQRQVPAEESNGLSWDPSYDIALATDGQAVDATPDIDNVTLPPSSELSQQTADILRNLGLQDSSNALAPDASNEHQEAGPGEGAPAQTTPWQRILHVCKQAGSYFAFDIPDTCNIEDVASQLQARYQEIESSSSSGVGVGKQQQITQAINDVMSEHGAKCAVLGTPMLKITNNDIRIGDSDNTIPEGYSSPYGFGTEVDGKIGSALSAIREIARRSSNNFTMTIPLEHLPRVIEAVEAEKARPPSGITWPQLGVGNTSSIDKKGGERLLKDITNTCLHATAEIGSPQEVFSGSVQKIAAQWEKREAEQDSSIASTPGSRSRSSTACSFTSPESALALQQLPASEAQQLKSAVAGLAQGLHNAQPGSNGEEAKESGQEIAGAQQISGDVSSVGTHILRSEGWAGVATRPTTPESTLTLDKSVEYDGEQAAPGAPTPTPDVQQKEGGLERQ
ncbi:ankyrin repeat-containing protein [Anaplasma centrale str. Israel]|uniref:Ankyrin repeat-containing protein n=1 Tax=Anaplasma centrale (strain Israel) TaxID=574556 RepID=D1AUL5_ANACI|nr:hypothetical protein [Anaplasma centrale]ACZ49243.1 ankyrin repeat-containing protein [Anaplasma centrale str. Israel]